MRIFVAAWLAALIGLASLPALALDDDGGMFSIETGNIDVAKPDGRLVTLKAAVVKLANAQNSLPIAIIAHGKPRSVEEAAAVSLDDYIGQAKDLAVRGYLAIIVLREGFGKSGGDFPGPAPCTRQAITELFEDGADDLQYVMTAARRRADVNSTEIIVVANSAGGPTALALAARRPNGLAAVIAVSGGLGLFRAAGPDQGLDSGCDLTGIMSDIYAGYARASSVPELFVYDSRDRFFGDGFYDHIHAAFFNAGGQGRAVPVDDPLGGGHNFFGTTNGRKDWLRQADLFLADRYLPAVTQKDVDGLVAALGKPDLRKLLDDYAHGPLDKAMAVSVSGRLVATSMADNSLAAARDNVLRECYDAAQERCILLFGNMVQLSRGP